ncbi:Nucleotidyl transferase [Sinosporangium album]|uniref:Nucleotidyl transferase n=1 Tax=Sinosporangium album TaxID=504805 RepID=A0A1G8A770_9ACTN|nr:sugar phosphate nucleotidyltransferase [Sinosporangium album]SDH16758.1 Nucleotidyl transferase [Sinosporangium album]
MHAIIMAGGQGTRLRSVTDEIPKSLVRLGDHPIIEIIVRRLRASGFRRVTLCVSHLGEMIEAALGEGGRLGVAIDYCWDTEELGTAAPLLRVPRWNEPALVMNCDILTSADLTEMFSAHVRSGSLLTLAARRIQIPVSFGVLDLDEGGRVAGIREKPQLSVEVSAGIQVVDPGVRAWMSAGVAMDMPELILALIKQRCQVRAHPLSASWHDIGTPASYRTAAEAFARSPDEFLRPRPAPLARPRIAQPALDA